MNHILQMGARFAAIEMAIETGKADKQDIGRLEHHADIVAPGRVGVVGFLDSDAETAEKGGGVAGERGEGGGGDGTPGAAPEIRPPHPPPHPPPHLSPPPPPPPPISL